MRTTLIALWQALGRMFRFLVVVLLGYLLQVCVMPYLRIGSVTPSLLFATIAVVTVAYGKLRAFWIGGVYGLLTETMMPSLPYLNLLMYPVSATFCSVFFADKSEKRLEYERSLSKAGRNLNPYLRTPLCAAANTLIYEVVNILYIYLGGTTLTMSHISKGIADILLTTLLTVLIMVPMRSVLGFHVRGKEKEAPVRY